MTLCPIAIVASCQQCPAFKICPLKGIIGDHVKPEEKQTKRPVGKAKGGTKRRR
jgi:hypothetical protein